MGFSYNFRNGNMDVIYHSEEARDLDVQVWEMMAQFPQLLPARMKQRADSYDFFYDITGATNLLAWQDEASPSRAAEIKRKKADALDALFRAGIAAEQLMQEERYIYVDESTEEIRLICIPLKVDRLDDVPPAPASDLPLDLYLSAGEKMTPLPSDLTSKEPTPSLLSAPDTEDMRSGSADFIPPSDEDDDDDKTEFYQEDDDEKTVLLILRPDGKAKLVRLETQETFPITENVTRIGRKKTTAEICLKGNPTLGREHCRILYREGKYYLEDNHSTNGTWLNGIALEPETPVELHDQSEIRLSNEAFIFQNEEERL